MKIALCLCPLPPTLVGGIRIAEQIRHASFAVLRRYVREGRLFERNLTSEIGL